MKTEILGVKIDDTNLDQAIDKISSWINAEKQNKVFTINAEFILTALKNESFRNVLNTADLATCDGSGPMWAGKYLHGQEITRVTGVDLTAKLLESRIPDLKIYLLGGAEGVAQAVRDKYPNAPIVGAESGGKLKINIWELEKNNEVTNRIDGSGANLILVAFGSPGQEMWIDRNLPLMPGIKVAIGIGGTFDFLSGQIKRAPRWMRKLGLEWLFRLIRQPSRIGRIWNAVIVFGWKVLKEKNKLFLW
jgi:N-acetylglucosaminyldiphosphoundecaprenol N-acetyl-beta-D-mannosaminyltransferase